MTRYYVRLVATAMTNQTTEHQITLSNCPPDGISLSCSCLKFHEALTKIGHTFSMNYYERA